MKKFLIICAMLLMYSCSGSTAPKEDGRITLQVFSSANNELLNTHYAEAGETLTISEKEPDDTSRNIRYYIYLQQAGHYTEIRYCSYGETVTVNMDSVDAAKFCGTVIKLQSGKSDSTAAEEDFVLLRDSFAVRTISTDERGRFAIDIGSGSYDVQVNNALAAEGYYVINNLNVSGGYKDIYIRKAQ